MGVEILKYFVRQVQNLFLFALCVCVCVCVCRGSGSVPLLP